MKGKLYWDTEKGIGRWIGTIEKPIYDLEYFKKYQEYDKTACGIMLCQWRRHFVRTITRSPILDIGIGAGGFMIAMGNSCKGYDVNPYTKKMLLESAKWLDPYHQTNRSIPAMTFWDSIEHIQYPEKLLEKGSGFVFVSLPIFVNEFHCRASKHFRPGEHLWYWTREGFVSWMLEQGWLLIDYSQFEIDAGREDIGSFAFSRFKKPLDLPLFMRGYTKASLFSRIIKGG